LCGYKAQCVLGFAGFGEIVFQRRPLDHFSNQTRTKSKHMALQVVARSVSVRKSASLEMWKKSFIGGAGSRQLSGVRLSVCPSVPSGRLTPLLRVCCCGPSGQMSIDCCTAGRRSAAAAPQHGAQQQMRGVLRCQLM